MIVVSDLDEDRLVQIAVAGAPEATTAQIDRCQSLLAPHLGLFASDAEVTELPTVPERREAPGVAA